MDPLTEKHRGFFKEQMHEDIYSKSRTEARRDVEQIDKGHIQHEHEEEMNIQCHRSAKKTKKSHILNSMPHLFCSEKT